MPQSAGHGPTLADVLTARPSGLIETESWAILCQSVQSLQDLFLIDGAYHSDQFVPLVTPSTLILSPKGRVRLSQTAPGALGGALLHPPLGYLAPEFRQNHQWTDAEVEKMWIYSLGETLKRATLTSHAATMRLSRELCQVLTDMTKIPAGIRASLMDLLDIISKYCRNRQQLRPFSHIVMDLHQMALLSTPHTDLMTSCSPPPSMPHIQPRRWLMPPLKKEAGTSMTDDFDSTTIPAKFPRRNPVQRAASRLYRARPQCECTGPEFVVRAALPPEQITIAANNTNGTKHTVTVILLNGQKLAVECNSSTTTVGQIFEAIIAHEHIEENFILGLSTLIAGDFVFLPSDTRVVKVLMCQQSTVNTILTLYMRVRFFLPTLRGLRSPQTRHLLYLQLRRAILEHQLPCTIDQLIELNGLALQTEFGDFKEREHGTRDYFLMEHYVPETVSCAVNDTERLRCELIAAHRLKYGTEMCRAEETFILLAQNLPHYGGHFYTATWMLKDNNDKEVWLYISPKGVNIYDRGRASNSGPQLYETFDWRSIQTLCYSKHYLCILPHSITVQGASKLKKYKLKMTHKKSYFAFRLASLHHQFYLRLKTEYTTLQRLSEHFGGVPVKIPDTTTTVFNVIECRRQISSTICSKAYRRSQSIQDFSSLSGINAVTTLPPCEKRRGVKMGTKVFGNQRVSRSMEAVNAPSTNSTEYLEEMSLQSISLRSQNDENDAAYILYGICGDDENAQLPLPDLQESVNDTLQDKLDALSFAAERILNRVALTADPTTGNLGLQITEGSDGNVYVQNVLPEGPAARTGRIYRGDQIVAVDGRNLLGVRYECALEILKFDVRKPNIELLLAHADNSPPVVVEMIPKRRNAPDPDVVRMYDTNNNDGRVAVPRTLGLCRKWRGPVRYPVTPARHSAASGSSDDEQVFI